MGVWPRMEWGGGAKGLNMGLSVGREGAEKGKGRSEGGRAVVGGA